MARRGRQEAAGAIHHVVPQGNGRGAIVRDDVDRQRFLQRLREVCALHGWEMLAASLLDTHAHLLLRTPEPDLGVGMRRLLGGYSKSFHDRHGGEGALFVPRFWSRRVTSEAQLVRSALYVDLNPVHAGLVDHPARYRWGTYGEPRPWLVGLFGDDPERAQAAYGSIVDDACDALGRAGLPDAVAEAIAHTVWAPRPGGRKAVAG